MPTFPGLRKNMNWRDYRVIIYLFIYLLIYFIFFKAQIVVYREWTKQHNENKRANFCLKIEIVMAITQPSTEKSLYHIPGVQPATGRFLLSIYGGIFMLDEFKLGLSAAESSRNFSNTFGTDCPWERMMWLRKIHFWRFWSRRKTRPRAQVVAWSFEVGFEANPETNTWTLAEDLGVHRIR